MSLVLRESRSGLVVAEQSVDEQSLQRELSLIDDRLILARDHDSTHQCWVWKVVCRVSDHQDAVTVCVWCDEQMRPLPLSSGLVELVKRQRPENRKARVDADTHNQRLTEERRRHFEDDVDDLARHYRRLVKDGPDPHDSEGMVLRPRRFGVA